MILVSDSFAGPSGRSRLTSSGQVGACYVSAPWCSAIQTLDGSSHLQPATTNECDLLASGTNASGNYTHTATLTVTGAVSQVANLWSRVQPWTGSINAYNLTVSSSSVSLTKWAASAQSTLASVSVSVAPDVYSVTWPLSGTSQTATVQRVSDGKYLTSGGAWQVGATTCVSATDATYATGQVGIGYYSSSGTPNALWGAWSVNDAAATVVPMPKVNVVWHGDSLTYQINATNAGTLLAARAAAVVAALGSTATYNLYGNPGHTLTQMISEVSTVVGLMDPAKLNVVRGQGAHNDYNAGATSAQVETRIGTYASTLLAAAAAAGCAAILTWDTELPAAYPGYPGNFDALRDASNAWLRANYRSAGISVLADLGADSILGPDGAEQNATYYSGSDHTHLTDAGYTRWGTLYDAPAVQQAVTLPAVAPAATATPTGATLAANAFGGVAPLTYAWSGAGLTYANSAVSNPTATVASAGTYTATLTVTDGNGHTATGSASVTVGPATISASPATIPAGQPQLVEVSGTLLSGNLTLGGTAGASVLNRAGLPPAAIVLTVQAPGYGTLTIADAAGVTATVTVVAAQPNPPTVVTASGSATVTWAATAGAASYKLYRNTSVVYTGSALTYADSGLANGTTYTYAVSAVDAGAHESPQSGAVTVTPTVPDYFSGATTGLDGPYTRAITVAPSDAVDLPWVTLALDCGTGVTAVQVRMVGSAVPVVLPVTAGTVTRVRATRVYATNTSSGTIVALG